uniref:Uncharacterized protein n=1 Tax=Arundo donax TaxID=35708 RepID=A0A0A9DRT4_ARUDO
MPLFQLRFQQFTSLYSSNFTNSPSILVWWLLELRWFSI